MGLCYLLLGSNLGDRAKNIELSRLKIDDLIGDIQNVSSIYESEPWGYVDSMSYYNQALCVKTDLSPSEVLRKCLSIEDSLGRYRTKDTYEPRTIDIDVLFYESVIYNSKDLTLPHPRMTERKFVLEPLNEINSTIVHPVLRQSVKELLLNCEDKCWVKRLDKLK